MSNKPNTQKPTHLVGRTKRVKFNRGGIRWETAWQAFELKLLTKQQIDAILAEPEVESRLCSADDAAELTAAPAPEGEAKITKAELVSANVQLVAENAELKKQLDNARAQIDHLVASKRGNEGSLLGGPPTQSEQAKGEAAPLPLPPQPQR